MLRFLATLLVLAAFATQTFQRSLIVFNYYTNTSAYNKNCENKTRPSLQCNGKCVMQKKLQEEEKKDQQNQSKQENRPEVVSSKSFFPSLTTYPTISNIRHYLHPIATKLASHSNTIFHPPSIV